MKIAQIALIAAVVIGVADAKSLRPLFKHLKHKETEAAAALEPAATEADETNRELQSNGCIVPLPAAAWHRTLGSWSDGFCQFIIDCNSPSYDSELECCKGAYGGQISGTCLSMLPSPPTMSPTEGGDLDVYYPDYDQPAWPLGFCINTRPLPSGRPAYTTMLDCCKGAYGGQSSGTCLSMLPSPPTTSPTDVGGLDVYYPDYDQPAWPLGFCINTRPLPSGRPTYTTMLLCCKGAYGGQSSGICLSMLPSPPTTSPTDVGELDVYYADYDQPAWPLGFCINTRPLPSGRPTFTTMLDCCKGAYGGQQSGVCLSQLPSPPTVSPTDAGEFDFWYPDYSSVWAEATCLNTRPLPFGPGGRPTYDTMLDCCKREYRSQASGACVAALPSPPTSSPTNLAETGGLDVYYPNYDQAAWPEGICISTRPLPSGRPSYSTKPACCQAHYGGQLSETCMCDAVNVCYSCTCGSQAERDAANCTLTCS